MSLDRQSVGQAARPPTPTCRRVWFALIAVAAFALYWSSSFTLYARGAVTHFGTDAHLYELLAKGIINDRTARFHPVTVGMSLVWMKALDPLTAWIAPHYLLKAMFAAIGAAGVWASMAAFATAAPRSCAPLCGAIYATSFGVWYFSSIEESKIVTATLCALYIASYLHLRARWTTRGAVLLTAILLVACLNEIVSCFLIVIPIVDTLKRQRWNWRHYSWIAAHGLAGPLAFAILEGVINGPLVSAEMDPERASHLSMLFFYIAQNDYGLANLYAFAVNWLFFNIAAPTPDASYAIPPWGNFKGYFEPALANYFSSPVSASLIAVAGATVVASALPRYRAELPADTTSILMALMAYGLLRGAFFFIFNPDEPLLFSPAITLAYMLVIGIPIAASDFPAKRTFLAAFAGLLFFTNGAFIVGR